MKTMFAKVEQVETRIESVRTTTKGRIQGTVANIKTFDDGIITSLKSMVGQIDTTRARLLMKTSEVEQRATAMLPPPDEDDKS